MDLNLLKFQVPNQNQWSKKALASNFPKPINSLALIMILHQTHQIKVGFLCQQEHTHHQKSVLIVTSHRGWELSVNPDALSVKEWKLPSRGFWKLLYIEGQANIHNATEYILRTERNVLLTVAQVDAGNTIFRPNDRVVLVYGYPNRLLPAP